MAAEKPEAVKALLDMGADANLQIVSGDTPLHMAILGSLSLSFLCCARPPVCLCCVLCVVGRGGVTLVSGRMAN